MVENRKLLTAIVPISQMTDEIHLLREWLPMVERTPLSVIIVHDIKDEHTSTALRLLLDELDIDDIEFMEGHFDGPGSARNFGLEKVETEWVCFWDSDDYPVVNVFTDAISNASLETKVLVTNFEVLDKRTEQKIASRIPSDVVELACQAGIWRYAFRTQFAQKSKFGSHKMGEDQLFLAFLPNFDQSMEYVDQISYRYIRGSQRQLTNDDSRIAWLGASVEELTRNKCFYESRNLLAVTIGIRLSMTLVKSGKIVFVFQGLQTLAKVITKCDYRISQLSWLFLRILVKAVRNA